jgi:hypothetical protein
MCLYTPTVFIHSSVALQPFVGPWPLLQFHNLIYTAGRTPWTGDQSVVRPLPTHMIKQIQKNAHTDIHASSVIRTHDPSVRVSEDNSCLWPRRHCDRHSHRIKVSYPGREQWFASPINWHGTWIRRTLRKTFCVPLFPGITLVEGKYDVIILWDALLNK